MTTCDCGHKVSAHQTGEGPWTGFCFGTLGQAGSEYVPDGADPDEPCSCESPTHNRRPIGPEGTTTDLYVAQMIDLKYQTIGLGRTPAEAKEAAAREYRRTNNAGYGLMRNAQGRAVRTVAQIEEWSGFHVYGPMPVGGGATEG